VANIRLEAPSRHDRSGAGGRIGETGDTIHVHSSLSGFAVDGRADLNMVIYNPATPADVDKVRTLLKSKP
jgi:hypothetical protein